MSISSKGSIALTAKLRAMYGKRLTPQNYKELLRKQNVSEIAAYLKQQTHYSDTLQDINENSVHRGQLENVIRRQLFTDYIKMLNYIGQDELKFYNFFLKRIEIDEILSCVRFLITNNTGEYFFSLPSYFVEHAKFDLYGLAKVKTYDELLNLLSKTPYYAILKKFDPAAETKTDMILIENEFNKYYYSYIFSIIDENFTGDVRSSIRESFGVEIDLINITEIIRLKKYFGVKSDLIRPIVLSYYFKIKKAEIARMIDAPDVETAMQILSGIYYGKYFEQNSFDYIERYSQQIKYEYNKNLLAFSTSSSLSVVAYLQLKRLEINNIISILEGVRYGINPSEISKVLIGPVD